MIVALVVALVVVTAVAAYLWSRIRALEGAIRKAAERIGVDAQKRPEATLTSGIERIERYLARAERERAQLVGSLEAAHLGVMATDDSGTITFVNKAAGDLVGVRHGEAVAEARIKDLLESVIVARSPQETELELYTPVRKVLNLRASPLDYGVESVGAVVFIEDVTGRRRADTIRRDFVSNVAHELKTPLTALSVLAGAVAETDDPGVRQKLSERLANESRRIAHLIDDILDLAQVESFAASPETMSMSDLISEAASHVQLAAEEAGIVVFTEPVPSEAFVAGDRRQLVMAIGNLLDNAIKYTLVKGEGSGKVVVRVSVDSQWVGIEVRDDGIGIPSSHLDRIFERFYRVDAATSSDTGGTGLGLAIVRHVALNHGGEVSVSSREGQGSTFILRLPRVGR